jgi:excisionase family DNA binding protein
MDDLELINVKQAAEELGVSGARVRQYIAQGRLAARKFGWQWLITRAEFERFAAIPRPTGKPPGKKEGE